MGIVHDRRVFSGSGILKEFNGLKEGDIVRLVNEKTICRHSTSKKEYICRKGTKLKFCYYQPISGLYNFKILTTKDDTKFNDNKKLGGEGYSYSFREEEFELIN
mgnify:CR=1 FL=1